MTFLIFFGFSSLAMSVSDIYFFIVILLKMRNNELFYQEDNKIYIIKKDPSYICVGKKIGR